MFSILFHFSLFALLARSERPECLGSPNSDVKSALKAAGVIPSVLPEFRGQVTLNVEYNGITVAPAGNLTINETRSEPALSINSQGKITKDGVYTVALVDPDAPTPQHPTFAQFLHFIQTDLTVSYRDDIQRDKGWRRPSRVSSLALTNQTAPLVPYVGPNPPAGSDPHRYVVALYRQILGLGSIKPPEGFPTNFTGVDNTVLFNLTEFVDHLQGGLELVGATFFYVGPDTTSSS